MDAIFCRNNVLCLVPLVAATEAVQSAAPLQHFASCLGPARQPVVLSYRYMSHNLNS